MLENSVFMVISFVCIRTIYFCHVVLDLHRIICMLTFMH